jgi:hypothetical protein
MLKLLKYSSLLKLNNALKKFALILGLIFVISCATKKTNNDSAAPSAPHTNEEKTQKSVPLSKELAQSRAQNTSNVHYELKIILKEKSFIVFLLFLYLLFFNFAL